MWPLWRCRASGSTPSELAESSVRVLSDYRASQLHPPSSPVLLTLSLHWKRRWERQASGKILRKSVLTLVAYAVVRPVASACCGLRVASLSVCFGLLQRLLRPVGARGAHRRNRRGTVVVVVCVCVCGCVCLSPFLDQESPPETKLGVVGRRRNSETSTGFSQSSAGVRWVPGRELQANRC